MCILQKIDANVENMCLSFVFCLVANDAFDYFGKCSHGGPYDDSKDLTAAGGVNKEGTDPVLAPHHYHHVQAAELAILSTELFLSSPGALFDFVLEYLSYVLVKSFSLSYFER